MIILFRFDSCHFCDHSFAWNNRYRNNVSTLETSQPVRVRAKDDRWILQRVLWSVPIVLLWRVQKFSISHFQLLHRAWTGTLGQRLYSVFQRTKILGKSGHGQDCPLTLGQHSKKAQCPNGCVSTGQPESQSGQRWGLIGDKLIKIRGSEKLRNYRYFVTFLKERLET